MLDVLIFWAFFTFILTIVGCVITMVNYGIYRDYGSERYLRSYRISALCTVFAFLWPIAIVCGVLFVLYRVGVGAVDGAKELFKEVK